MNRFKRLIAAVWFISTVGLASAGSGGDDLEAIRQNARGLERLFEAVAEKVKPSVVHVSPSRRTGFDSAKESDVDNIPEDVPEDFRHFFRSGRGPRSRGVGSGFIVDPSGYVITNFHVIKEADSIQVTLLDGRTLAAEVVGVEREADLALLKMEGKNFPAVELANSDDVRVGQWVLAIGSPFGLDWTVTQGIISAVRPGSKGLARGKLIQTDAAVNPGNSGGPLVDLDGRVIGVNTMIVSQMGGFQGISMAVPIKAALNLVRSKGNDRPKKQAWIGGIFGDIPAGVSQKLIQGSGAAVLLHLRPGSPASEAGLKTGDLILNVNGEPVPDAQAFQSILTEASPGDVLKLVILGKSGKKAVQLTLGEKP